MRTLDMAWKYGLIIVMILFLSVLFYFSPYSEISIDDCILPKDVPNPAGAQLQPYCGLSILRDEPPFPFRTEHSAFIEFCRKSIKTVELSCNGNVSKQILVLNGLDYSEANEYECVFSMDDGHKIIVLQKNPSTEFRNEDTLRYDNLTIGIYSDGYQNNRSFDYAKDCINLKNYLASS